MPIPTLLADLAVTAALNSPAGGESVTTTDDYLRAQAAFIAQLRDRVQSVALGGTGAITAAAAADALGAFRRGTLLGTVSQTGGVPTGAIIERGSNANGDYVRFADGTQICTHVLPDQPISANANTNVTWTYPAAFAAVNPRFPAWIGIPNLTGDVYGFVHHQGIGTLSATQTFRNGGTAQVLFAVNASVTGRWF